MRPHSLVCAVLVLVVTTALLAEASVKRRGSRGGGEGRSSTCHTYNSKPWANLDNPDRTERGFLVLSLTWPGGFCSHVQCKTAVEEPDFTIHGLWPNYAQSRGTHPACCRTTPQLYGREVVAQVEEDKGLVEELAEHWPNFKASPDGGMMGSFLAYEFDKHGTCAMEVFSSPIEYIKTALELKKSYDYFGVLDLSPDELRYGAERSEASLTAAFMKYEKGPKSTVMLVCDDGYLSEIRVCINKGSGKWEPFNCPLSLLRENGKCPEDTEIKIHAWPFPYGGDDGDDGGDDDGGNNNNNNNDREL